MSAPYFSRREVLNFLVSDAPRIEAGTKSKCWQAVWTKFSNGVFDSHGHDGPYLDFERVCQFYGYGPTQNRNHTWVMKNANLESVP